MPVFDGWCDGRPADGTLAVLRSVSSALPDFGFGGVHAVAPKIARTRGFRGPLRPGDFLAAGHR